MPRWALALIFLAGAGLLFAGYRINQQTRKPNVVFLVLDTLRYDRLHGQRNGQPIMPFLSQYAKGGADFAHAISPCSWTRPTMASLFTATYPETHQVRFSLEKDAAKNQSDMLSPGFDTLPEALRDAGFDNWGLQTNMNVQAELGFGQGFPEGQYDFTGYQPAEKLTDKALFNLPKMKPPFFLFMQYLDPHGPYTPLDEYAQIFGPPPVPTEQDARFVNGAPAQWTEYVYDNVNAWIGKQEAMQFPPLSEAGMELIRYRYDAECRYLDDQLARLVRTIEGQFPHTVFVIVSDHGEAFWERGTVGHGQHLYEELIHVPFILRGPGVPQGEVKEPVGTIGILPTLARMLGLPENTRQWQAKDVFEQARTGARVYSWTKGSHANDLVNVEAVLEGKMKLLDHQGVKRKGTERYDLATDPGETKNLYPGDVAEDTRWLAALDRHREDNAEAAKSVTKASFTLSEEYKRQLHELGYEVDEGKPPAEASPPAEAAEPPPPSGDAAPAPAGSARNEQLEALGYLGGEEEKKKVATPGPAARPNVLLVVVDTLRADRVEAVRNGVPVMPHLHRLARESAWFKHAIAPASWTKPSVTSLLTGLYPATHGVQFGVQNPWVDGQRMVIQGLPPEKPTLLSLLKGQGYHTGTVQTNMHLQAMYGYGAGCDAFDFARWGDATTVTDRTLAQVDGLGAPFLAYAHYFDPHADYAPPEPHRAVFGPLPPLSAEEEDLLRNDYHRRYYLEKAKLDMGLLAEKKLGSFSEAGREHVRQLYDGECHYTDEQLYRLIGTVRAQHPETIVVITSDHGEEFWEHGSIGHAKTVYQEVIHVPLIISVPGMAARVVEMPVETIDLLPTLAVLLGVTVEPSWQGRDILAEPLEARPVFSETRGSFPEARLHKEAAILGTEKLVRDVSKGTRELYGLASDPREAQNLAGQSPERADALGALLDTHNASAAAHPLASVPPTETPVDGSAEAQETVEALKAIGYLGGAEAPAQ